MTKKDDKNDFRSSPLTVLELMALLALLGIVIAWIATYFFGAN